MNRLTFYFIFISFLNPDENDYITSCSPTLTSPPEGAADDDIYTEQTSREYKHRPV